MTPPFHPAKILLLQLSDPSADAHKLNNCFIDFCIYFNKLTKRFARNDIQDQQLVDVILLKDDLTNSNNLRKHIYAANATFQRLLTHMFPSNILGHSHIIKTLLFDIYQIIYIAEDFGTNGDPLSNFHRDEQTGREIYDASRYIYYIQSAKPHEDYLREIVPVSIFLIRQSLEILGKKCLGVDLISSASRQRYKNTNVSWDYITQDQRTAIPKVVLPINVDIINKIIIWTNSYIHTGELKEYYILENIHNILLKLYFKQPATARIRDYRGSLVSFGVIRIQHYNQLKIEFDAFVNKMEYSKWQRILIKLKLKKVVRKWSISWIPISQLKEVTIASL